MKKKATIFDVAEIAGVSIKTVSRVVNNEPNVREKTREKVTSAIARLDYQPNSAARGLSGQRSFALGLVYENPEEFSYIGAMLNGALEACEAEGYSLLLRPLTLSSADVVEEISAFARQARLDGIILPAPLGDDHAVLKRMRDMDIPIATITPKKPARGAINIDCEDEEASFKLTEYLISQGHERVGFIKGHPDHGASEKRFSGYKRALKAHGMVFKSSYTRQGYFDFQSGQSAARRLLDLAEPPTVIIASNDDMAAGVMFEARDRNIPVPEQLSIAGFDDTPMASHVWPPLTTVRQPIRDMADTAVHLLIQKIRGESDRSYPRSFECEIIIRNSSSPPLVS